MCCVYTRYKREVIVINITTNIKEMSNFGYLENVGINRGFLHHYVT